MNDNGRWTNTATTNTTEIVLNLSGVAAAGPSRRGAAEGLTRLAEGGPHTPRLRLADASQLARQELPQLARRELAQLHSTSRELPQLARRLLQQLARQERRHQHQKEWLQDTNNMDDRTWNTDVH